MEMIYDWLQNTGNAGNYYTILNTQHKTTLEESGYIDVMVRDKNHDVVNLLIYDLTLAKSDEINPDRLQGRTQKTTYSFQNEQQVIDYLSDGKAPELIDKETNAQVKILVLEPTSESGTVTFPPIN